MQSVVDGIREVAHDEAVFEFSPDGFRCAVKDAANVALIKQEIDAADFPAWEVSEPFLMGVNCVKLDDLIGVVSKGAPIKFDYNFDKFVFDVEFEDVHYTMAGIDPEQVNGRVETMPPVKDELDYCVDVTMPVGKWEKATQVVELSGAGAGQADFEMSEDGFVIAGNGDTDKSSVDIHEDDDFEWREDPPARERICTQSNDYMQEIVDLIDEDAVRLLTGDDLPYHVWTTRNDVIETKFMQAPRLKK